MINTLSKYTGILGKLKHYLPFYILSMLYFTMVNSHLNYGVLVWHFSPTRLIKIRKLITRTINAKTNAVKQGAFSLILSSVYINELLCRINDSGVGCHIGHMSFAGAGYADDVVIMVISVRAFQELLYISESFATEYNVLFNASKTCV